MIYVENLRKEFKKTIKEPGIVGSIKSLFHPQNETVVAVDDISFHVPKGEILGFIGITKNIDFVEILNVVVKKDLSVIVRAPIFVSNRDIQKFIEDKSFF